MGDGERDLNTEVKIGTTIDLANYAILSVEVRDVLNHDKNSDWSIGAEITPLENLALQQAGEGLLKMMTSFQLELAAR